MGNFGMFLTFLISFGLVIWNANLMQLNRELQARCRSLQTYQKVIECDFRDYKREVKKAVEALNGKGKSA